MDQSQILPSPTSKAFQNVKDMANEAGWGSRSFEQSEEDVVIISSDTPVDTNCQHAGLKAKITAILGIGPKYNLANTKAVAEPVAILELCKVNNFADFKEACAKYEAGLKAGWSNGELVKMIVEIRYRRDRME